MVMRIYTLLFAFLLFTRLATSQTNVTVDVKGGKHTISKHIYGHFAEHLGNCIYGGFYVGEENRTIAHQGGVRLDVVDALKKLKIPNLRWPGGCFADTYHWKDGVGPKEKRPTIVNTWWGGVTEDNSYGTHNFLNMCELLQTEPYLSANVGSGTVQELAEWMQYTTFDGISPMSLWRKQNGREQPWKVKFWGVGNEAWGCGGNMRPEHYVDVYRQYATFMTGWDNSNKVFRIASGANSSDYNWTEVLMRDIPHHMLEGVALHHYSVIDWNKKSSATGFTEAEYFTTLQRALFMDELIEKHSAIMDKYDPTKKIALVVDEWGGWYDVEKGMNPGFLFQQNTMRDAMIAGVTLNIFQNHADRVRMANLAQTINVLQAVILTKEEKMILTPTYHVMEMYNVHQDATLLPVQLQSPYYKMGNEQLKSVSASASINAAGEIHLTLVNIHATESQEVSIDLQSGKAVFNTITGRILTSKKLQDHNTFDNPRNIQPITYTGAILNNNILKAKLPPFSVVVLKVK
jgi:alpha-N-arabinofuranosidase